MARIEKEHNVSSTYFVLVTSNLYNIANKYVRDAIVDIARLGHSIGLHFDETQYAEEEIYNRVKNEKEILEKIVGHNIIVDSVSMHIPSRRTLEANYDFGNDMINSYSENFFMNGNTFQIAICIGVKIHLKLYHHADIINCIF